MFFAVESDQPQGEWARGITDWIGDFFAAISADWLRFLVVGVAAIMAYFVMRRSNKSQFGVLSVTLGAGVATWWLIGLAMGDNSSTPKGVGQVSWLWRVWTDIGNWAGVLIVLAGFVVFMSLGRTHGYPVRILLGALTYVALTFVAFLVEQPIRNVIAETQQSSIGNAEVQTMRPNAVYALGPGPRR